MVHRAVWAHMAWTLSGQIMMGPVHDRCDPTCIDTICIWKKEKVGWWRGPMVVQRPRHHVRISPRHEMRNIGMRARWSHTMPL